MGTIRKPAVWILLLTLVSAAFTQPSPKPYTSIFEPASYKIYLPQSMGRNLAVGGQADFKGAFTLIGASPKNDNLAFSQIVGEFTSVSPANPKDKEKVLQTRLVAGAAILTTQPGNIYILSNVSYTQGATPTFQARLAPYEMLAAVANNDLMGVQALLARSKDEVKRRIDRRWSPLASAAISDHLEIARVLVDAGADLNEKSAGGATALHEAAFNDHLDIAKLLLDQGANLNITDMAGGTALAVAASSGNADIVQLLLEKGADVTIRDRSGKTAADEADAAGYDALADLIAAQAPAAFRWWLLLPFPYFFAIFYNFYLGVRAKMLTLQGKPTPQPGQWGLGLALIAVSLLLPITLTNLDWKNQRRNVLQTSLAAIAFENATTGEKTIYLKQGVITMNSSLAPDGAIVEVQHKLYLVKGRGSELVAGNPLDKLKSSPAILVATLLALGAGLFLIFAKPKPVTPQETAWSRPTPNG